MELGDVENLFEAFGVPRFRVRRAFKQCDEHLGRTLGHLIEEGGRHLGYICDRYV